MTTQTRVGTQQLLDAFRYIPTVAQAEILNDTHRFQLVAGGFRGGKSQTASMKAVLGTIKFLALYPDQAKGQVAWLVGEDYERTRAEFNYIRDLLIQFPPTGKSRATLRVDPGEIRVPVEGGVFTIKTKSAADPRALGMEAPIWIVVCEAAHVSADVYERLLSRTSEARQRFPEFGWMHMEGTFEGSLGWYPSLWQKWQTVAIQETLDSRSFSLPSHSNTILYPGGMNDPEIVRLKASMPENAFAERHLGIPVPPSGRVHTAFDPAVHVRDVKYDPDLPVYLGIDPGYSGQPSTYAVEVAQLVPVGESGFKQWRVFDEIAVNKFSQPGFTTHDVCLQATQREWWKNEMKHAVMDIAGRQHAGATVEGSEQEIWRKRTGLTLFDRPVPVKAGIDRFDLALKSDPVTGEPGILFSPRASLVVSELGGAPNPYDGETHVYKWRTNREGDVVGKVPDDKYCDGVKALTYLMVDVQGFAFDSGNRTRIAVISRRRKRQGSRRKRRTTVRIG